MVSLNVYISPFLLIGSNVEFSRSLRCSLPCAHYHTSAGGLVDPPKQAPNQSLFSTHRFVVVITMGMHEDMRGKRLFNQKLWGEPYFAPPWVDIAHGAVDMGERQGVRTLHIASNVGGADLHIASNASGGYGKKARGCGPP